MTVGKNRMPWIRLHSEFLTDLKLRSLPAAERLVFIYLLLYASEQENRGTFPDNKPHLLALEVSEGSEELLESVIQNLLHLEILSRNSDETLTFTNWLSYQGLAPSDEPEAMSDRQRKHRQNVTEFNGASRNVTECHDLVTECHAESRRVTPSHAIDIDIDKEVDIDTDREEDRLVKKNISEENTIESTNVDSAGKFSYENPPKNIGEKIPIKDLRDQLTAQQQVIFPKVLEALRTVPMKKGGTFNEKGILKAFIQYPHVDHLRIAEKMPEWCEANRHPYLNVGYAFKNWCERSESYNPPQKPNGNQRGPSGRSTDLYVERAPIKPSGHSTFDQIRQYLLDEHGGGYPIISADLEEMIPLPVKNGVLQIEHELDPEVLVGLSIPQQVEKCVDELRLPIEIKFAARSATI